MGIDIANVLDFYVWLLSKTDREAGPAAKSHHSDDDLVAVTDYMSRIEWPERQGGS